LRENWPGKQSSQEVAPTFSVQPFPQDTEMDELPAECFPAGHAKQLVSSVGEDEPWCEPAGQ